MTKKEAREKGITASDAYFDLICWFHLKNPDQAGMQSCNACIQIKDKCGCDFYSGCEECGEPL